MDVERKEALRFRRVTSAEREEPTNHIVAFCLDLRMREEKLEGEANILLTLVGLPRREGEQGGRRERSSADEG